MNLKSSDRAQPRKSQTSTDKGAGYCVIYSFQREKLLRNSDRVEGKRPLATAFALVPLMFLAACASSPSTRSGALTSYEGLAPSNNTSTKSQIRVNREAILAANTVRIAPTRFENGVGSELSDADRQLVVNRVDRALCKDLSKRLDVVGPSGPADLSVQATITHLGITNRLAAAGSVAVSFVSVIPMVTPRVPFGLGSLTVEAEALNPAGKQEAAMVWSRGAQYVSVMGSTTVSEVSDAYQLASVFGENFGELLTTGETPFERRSPMKLPKFGGKKKDVDCEAYGRGSGVMGFVAENFGAPPGWTDKGAQKAADPNGADEDGVRP
ncbi:DUF3313 domain-containing protein [Caulobacter sp.]|uniref:DUF3313 domain-containing protein n=1 Tax=Caulobacter sp. TaxID=78 RepID=UPI003BB16EA6